MELSFRKLPETGNLSCLLNYNSSDSSGDEDDGACKKGMQWKSEDPGDELCHLETCVPVPMSYCCCRHIVVLVVASESNQHLIFTTFLPALKKE